jgi:hypothetical protein
LVTNQVCQFGIAIKEKNGILRGSDHPREEVLFAIVTASLWSAAARRRFFSFCSLPWLPGTQATQENYKSGVGPLSKGLSKSKHFRRRVN